MDVGRNSFVPNFPVDQLANALKSGEPIDYPRLVLTNYLDRQIATFAEARKEAAKQDVSSDAPVAGTTSPSGPKELSKWSDKEITQYLGKHFNTFMDADAKPRLVLSSMDSGDKEFVTRASLERVANSKDGQFTPEDMAFASELLNRKELFSGFGNPNCSVVDEAASKRDVYDKLVTKKVYEGKEVGGDENAGNSFTVDTYALYGEDGTLLMKNRYVKHGDFGGASWKTDFL